MQDFTYQSSYTVRSFILRIFFFFFLMNQGFHCIPCSSNGADSTPNGHQLTQRSFLCLQLNLAAAACCSWSWTGRKGGGTPKRPSCCRQCQGSAQSALCSASLAISSTVAVLESAEPSWRSALVWAEGNTYCCTLSRASASLYQASLCEQQ